jgi:hypothetical protein
MNLACQLGGLTFVHGDMLTHFVESADSWSMEDPGSQGKGIARSLRRHSRGGATSSGYRHQRMLTSIPLLRSGCDGDPDKFCSYGSLDPSTKVAPCD